MSVVLNTENLFASNDSTVFGDLRLLLSLPHAVLDHIPEFTGNHSYPAFSAVANTRRRQRTFSYLRPRQKPLQVRKEFDVKARKKYRKKDKTR